LACLIPKSSIDKKSQSVHFFGSAFFQSTSNGDGHANAKEAHLIITRGFKYGGHKHHHLDLEHNSESISKKDTSTMLNWSSFDRHHNQRHSEYSPCSSFPCPSLVFFPSVWKFRLQRHLFLPSSGLTSSFHPIPIQSSNDTCHPKYSFSFHFKKISAVSVLGISDSIRSDMIKLQVGLPRARPENRCNRPLEGRKFIDGMQA
jgi:hypothetical protein